MESIEQTFNGTVDFNRKVTCTVSRNGDLIHRTYLQVTLPALSNPSKTVHWTQRVGEALIDYVNVEIGGQEIVYLSVSKNENYLISKRIILHFFCDIIKLRGHPKAEKIEYCFICNSLKMKIYIEKELSKSDHIELNTIKQHQKTINKWYHGYIEIYNWFKNELIFIGKNPSDINGQSAAKLLR